jgi:hypothetical protein
MAMTRIHNIALLFVLAISQSGWSNDDVVNQYNTIVDSLPYSKCAQKVYEAAASATTHKVTGFTAETYQREDKTVIAFKGSNSARDWLANTSAAFGNIPIQFAQADRIVKEYVKEHGTENLVITGHSLGGQLAFYTGEKYGVRTYGFNAPEINSAMKYDIMKHRGDLGGKFEAKHSVNIYAREGYQSVLGYDRDMSARRKAGSIPEIPVPVAAGTRSSTDRYTGNNSNGLIGGIKSYHDLDGLIEGIKNTKEMGIDEYRKRVELWKSVADPNILNSVFQNKVPKLDLDNMNLGVNAPVDDTPDAPEDSDSYERVPIFGEKRPIFTERYPTFEDGGPLFEKAPGSNNSGRK